MKAWAAALLALALAGCAGAPPACGPGLQAMVSDVLYFGTARPQGSVSDAQFAAFVDDAVTPRFPDGLTLWRAKGQWRARDGRIVAEGSHVLNVVHAGDERSERAVAQIVSAYKSRFDQESVLRVKGAACVSF